MKARRLSPAEAVERGRRLLAQRRAAEAWARRPAWNAPGLAETTEPRRSPLAPERWPRLWRGPTLIPRPTIVAADVNVAANPPPSAGGGGRADAGIPAQTADASPLPNTASRVKPAPERLPGRAGGMANRKPRAVSVGSRSEIVGNCRKLDRPATHPPGAWPIADLGERQCRFACTPDDAPSHRFCGAPTVGLSSWCEEHLLRVAAASGRSAGGASVADVRAGRHGATDGRRSVSSMRTGTWR